MSLRNIQSDFCLAASKLIQYAFAQGYELTFGDAYRDPRVHGAMGTKVAYGHAQSKHKVRLAVDLNLFVNGAYITSGTAEYAALGKYWNSLGGIWGGDFRNKDYNHFEWPYR